MTTTHRVFDPGLQPERTSLAWVRTTLALAVLSVAFVRVGPPAVAVGCALAGLAAGLTLSAIARRRSTEVARSLQRDTLSPATALAAATTVTCLGLGVVGAVLVLAGR